MRDPTETAAKFAKACEAARVGYAFIGGVAVAAWGNPRATADIDVLLDLRPEDDAAFVAALAGAGLEVDTRDLTDARSDRSHVTIFDDPAGWHLDIKLVRDNLERDQVMNARAKEVNGVTLHVAAPEETIAFKVKFGSPLDLDDARWIVRRQRDDLDLRRLRALAMRLGVQDTVETLLEEER